MSTQTLSRESLLHEAFARFERAAVHLREEHERLRRRVARLEARLVGAHRRLRAVLDALDTGVAVVAADGTIAETNPAFDRLGLARRGERPGGVLGELIAGAGRRRAARCTHAVGGQERHLCASLLPVGGESQGWVLAVKDVTDLRREDEEGERRQRLEALGRLAAEIAHEVRNPLGSMRLFAGMLGRDPDPSTVREAAQQLLAAVASLERTVSNLLAFARPPRTRRVEVELVALAREICGWLAPAAALRGVCLEGPEGGPATVHADGEALRQVLLNLVGNALAACRRGDRIRVALRGGSRDVELIVQDTGCGIAPEDLPRVFDPFFSRREGGTGLGLSIVHRVVEDHGGWVGIESRAGAGTTVTVRLPRRGSGGRSR